MASGYSSGKEENKMRFALAVFGVGLLHFFGSFMAGFCGGIYGGLWRVLANALMFPLSVVPKLPDGIVGWILWGLLSLAWGWAICALVRHFLPTGTSGVA